MRRPRFLRLARFAALLLAFTYTGLALTEVTSEMFDPKEMPRPTAPGTEPVERARPWATAPKQESTTSGQVASLSAWRLEHQRADDEQFKELRAMQAQMAATSIEREHRLTQLENQYAQQKSQMEKNAADLDHLLGRMWVLICGLLAQLAKMVYDLLLRRQRSEDEAARPHGRR